jgi:heptose-I-phosphate ethanolaminephosphotransferase
MFSQRTLQLVAETNPRESSEFVGTLLFQKDSLSALAITLGCLLLTYGLLRFIKKIWNKAWYVKFYTAINSKKAYLKISATNRAILVFCMFACIIWSGVRQIKAYNILNTCFHFTYQFDFEDPDYQPHLETPFMRLAYGAAYNYVLFNSEINVLIKSVENTQVDSCSYRCPLIVMVIGESYNKHHCQLYKPMGHPTTPRLKAKADQGNLYPYTDVIAPFNHTAETFRYMLSTWDEDSKRQWAEHTLVTAAFKKAGYNVYFITNQYLPTAKDKFDVYGGRIFNFKNMSEMQFSGRNTKWHQYDGDLLTEIPSLDTLTQHPTLLIVHLLGQHFYYDKRYPEEFNVFKPEEVSSKYDYETPRNTIANYENATLYNDFVVDSLFNMFKDEDAIALYFSDHGEEVFDWRWRSMRTDEPEISPIVAYYQYEIPFMFYMSDRFMENHPDISSSVKQYTNRPFILTDLPNLLFHLGGISMPDYRQERDLLSERYDTNRKRIIRNKVDYDLLMKDHTPTDTIYNNNDK